MRPCSPDTPQADLPTERSSIDTMPLIHISILEGRSAQMKHRLIEELAHGCARALEIPVERVHVAIHEMSADDYGVGGVSVAQTRAIPPTP